MCLQHVLSLISNMSWTARSQKSTNITLFVTSECSLALTAKPLFFILFLGTGCTFPHLLLVTQEHCKCCLLYRKSNMPLSGLLGASGVWHIVETGRRTAEIWALFIVIA